MFLKILYNIFDLICIYIEIFYSSIKMIFPQEGLINVIKFFLKFYSDRLLISDLI